MGTVRRSISCSSRIVLPKRWWYSGGQALGRIRVHRLYRETHSDFHQYCLERFNKTRRHIDRWIAAAAALDNLTESGCTVLPTALVGIEAHCQFATISTGGSMEPSGRDCGRLPQCSL